MTHMQRSMLALAVALAGCGGGAPRAETSAHETAAPEYAAPSRPWAELDHDARRAHMVQHVLPRTSELFTSYDDTRYADFSCTTCHGADASERNFAMPNPTLITLYPTGSVGQEAVLAQYTATCTFMYSRLVPAVVTMLGASEYDPATRQGFSCFSCHPRAEESDPRSAPAH